MPIPSVFIGLDQAKLYYLKSQYLTSLQIVDQAESALQAQLDDVGKARKQLTDLMSELDEQIAKPVAPVALHTPDLLTAHRVNAEPGDPESGRTA